MNLKNEKKRYRGIQNDEVYPPHEVLQKYPKYLEKLGVYMRLPIIDWATSEVFELLAGRQNPLYDFGFDRVGCFPCLMGGEKDQVRAFTFDDTGRRHFKIAEQISTIAGRPVLTTKKYGGGCAICSI